MKQLPKKDPPDVGGGITGVPCTDPPLVPGTSPFPKFPVPDPIPDPIGPDYPYEGPCL